MTSAINAEPRSIADSLRPSASGEIGTTSPTKKRTKSGALKETSAVQTTIPKSTSAASSPSMAAIAGDDIMGDVAACSTSASIRSGDLTSTPTR